MYRLVDGWSRGMVALALVGALLMGRESLARPGTRAPGDELDTLFAQLKAARSAGEASRLEARIEAIWRRSGDPTVDSLFALALAAVARDDDSLALGYLARVTERAPHFAEGWNERASAEYRLGEVEEAVRDMEQTLLLERRHFGAMAGLALIYLDRGSPRDALRMFEQALTLDPASVMFRRRVQRLRDLLGYRSV